MFTGAIDELRIYNRELSEDEILENYNSEFSIKHIYNFSSISDNTIVDTINGYNFTSHNMDSSNLISGPRSYLDALSFNGSDEFLNYDIRTYTGETTDFVSLTRIHDNYTISFWMRTSVTPSSTSYIYTENAIQW